MNIKKRELILHWFEHIVQLASDKKTANGVVMPDEEAFGEIAVLAKDACYYVERWLQ